MMTYTEQNRVLLLQEKKSVKCVKMQEKNKAEVKAVWLLPVAK